MSRCSHGMHNSQRCLRCDGDWEDGETRTVQWLPHHLPLPAGAADHGPGPAHHGEYSRLIEVPSMKAHEICAKASELVGGDRAETHGDKIENHENIAALWNAYLGWRLDGNRLTAKDAALMMALLKIARTKLGDHNPDDYIDLAGYAGCAGEIAGKT